MPKKLTTILGINHTPTIYTDNHVLKNLERFAIGTGNNFLISYKYLRYQSFFAAVNNNGYTKKITPASSFSINEKIDKFAQNNKDFENDTLDYKLDTI